MNKSPQSDSRGCLVVAGLVVLLLAILAPFALGWWPWPGLNWIKQHIH